MALDVADFMSRAELAAHEKLRIAVIGATGNVGHEMLEVLEERGFGKADVVAIASRRSQGTEVSFGDRTLKVQALESFDFAGTDIALMSDELLKLPWLIRHSRRTLAIVRQNIGFSLAVKALFVILTFAGFASLWSAIAADMGASLLVIFNGLKLLKPLL